MTVEIEAVDNLQFRQPVPLLRKALQWIAGFSLWRPAFFPGAVYVGFVADNGAVGLDFLRVLRTFPIGVISPVRYSIVLFYSFATDDVGT